jgi:hypothetical protein
MIQSLHGTAKEELGEKQKRQSRKMWWTEEIEGLIDKKKKPYQKRLNTKREEDKKACLETKRQTRRIIIAEKNEMWERKMPRNKYVYRR